jgi:hypothetical protein
MIHRLQVSPLSDTPKAQSTDEANNFPTNFKDVKFFRSWLIYPDRELSHLPRRTDWNPALGLTIATVVSAGFWVVLGLVLAHFWR